MVFGSSSMTQMLANLFHISLVYIGIRQHVDNTTHSMDPLEEVELIPRSLLFGAQENARGHVSLSPDGHFISFIAPSEGVPNIWIQPIPTSGPRPNPFPATFETESYTWAYLPGIILYAQDNNGDENWRLYRLNVTSNETIPISATDGVSAEIHSTSSRLPGLIIIGLNQRDPRYHDLYTLDLQTGKKSLLFLNNGFKEVILDNLLTIRLAARETDEGGTEFVAPLRNAQNEIEAWESYRIVSLEDDYSTKVIAFHNDNTHVYWADSVGFTRHGKKRDLATLVLKSFDDPNGPGELIYEPKRSDIQGVLFHPKDLTPIGVKEDYLKPVFFVLDKRFKDDFHFLFMEHPDYVLNVHGLSQVFPSRFHQRNFILCNGVVVRKEGMDKSLDFLFTPKEEYLAYNLSRVYPVEVKTRDNFTEVCYVGLPIWVDRMNVEIPVKPMPMIMDVHGGPWQRDFWGFDSGMQHLTNRGYAVMRCNYRGSLGYGKRFFEASFGEWAGRMHDDILDAVNWAVKRRIADPDKIAIIGGSYGGYETLVGLSFTPDVFACGVDVVGPSNLLTLVHSIPPYWLPLYRSFLTRIGADPALPEGRTYLTDRSPLFHAHNIKKPVLIAQGANDPRVNRAESDQIVRVLKANRIPVSYIVFPDEGHGFVRSENQNAYRAVMEHFLADCLKGRSEPLEGELEKSSIQIVEQGSLEMTVDRSNATI